MEKGTQGKSPVLSRGRVIRKAFLKSLPVLAAYEVLGMGFGILMTRNGYGPAWTFLSSLLIYAGSMQFVEADLLVSAASLPAAALMTLMVNARHLFYGISMVGRYRDMGRAKPYLVFGLTDETYSILCRDEDWPGAHKRLYCFFVTLFDQFYWVSGSVLGALLGRVLPFDSKGIEFSMTALFVTVFAEQWLSSPDHRPALTGILASAACLLVFGPSAFLIPAMVLIALLLSLPWLKKRQEERKEDGHA